MPNFTFQKMLQNIQDYKVMMLDVELRLIRIA